MAGCAALALFYACARRLSGGRPAVSLASTAVLACDGQFQMASRFARQEILLCCVMLGCLLLFLREEGALRTRTARRLALLTGLSIGLHPNSFLVAALCGGCFALFFLLRRANLRQLGLYIGLTACFAALFIGLSLLMDGEFPAHYLAYGESEFSLVSATLGDRLKELPLYFEKLWHRVSGTYYIPELRPDLLFLPLLLGLSLLLGLRRKAGDRLILLAPAAALGLLLGTVLIGRYSQPAFVFFVPVCLLALPALCPSGRRGAAAALTLALGTSALGGAVSAIPWLTHENTYGRYLENISQYVAPDDRVLGNLNSEFYFDCGCLRDYRNLSYLKEAGLPVSEYLQQNGIEYVLFYEELDAYYAVRPKWNGLYGNLRWLPELKTFLAEHCQLVGRFEDDTYAVRLRDFMDAGRGFGVSVWRLPNW